MMFASNQPMGFSLSQTRAGLLEPKLAMPFYFLPLLLRLSTAVHDSSEHGGGLVVHALVETLLAEESGACLGVEITACVMILH